MQENESIKCPICGSTDVAERYDGNKFCRACGAEMIPCGHCGSYDVGKDFNGNKFCRSCGARGEDLLKRSNKVAQQEISECYYCGSNDVASRFDGGLFCRDCGAELFPCAICGGHKIGKRQDGSLFCKSCGASGEELKKGKSAEKNRQEETPTVQETAGKEDNLNHAAAAVSSVLKDGKKLVASGIEKGKKQKLPKAKVKPLILTAVIMLAVVLLTVISVKSNAPLENEWIFGANTYTFNEDQSFAADLGGVHYDGTYEADGSVLKLNYKFMGLIDKSADLEYAIKGKILTLTGDVTLLGVSSETLEFECASGGGGALKVILIVVEIAAGVAVCFVLLKKKTTKPQNDGLRCPQCGKKIKPDTDFCGNCGAKIK